MPGECFGVWAWVWDERFAEERVLRRRGRGVQGMDGGLEEEPRGQADFFSGASAEEKCTTLWHRRDGGDL